VFPLLPVLVVHCRRGVDLLPIVVMVLVAALTFPRPINVRVDGWLCLGVGLDVATSL